MSYNKFGRGRTPPQPPPFDFDDPMRPIPNHGDFDNPYMVPPHMLDRPNRGFPGGPPPHVMDMPPMHLHPPQPPHIPPSMMSRPYIEAQGHHYKNYPQNFSEPHYDRPSPSGSYAGPMNYGDPHATHLHNPIYPEPRSSSPPYKILCITNINQKISDDTVKETLTSDFSRFGDISVSICHDSGERLAYIYFRNCDDAREARQFKTRTIFFDRPIEIEPIYEPVGDANSPDDISPSSPMVQPPPGPPIYSPRRRSVSPPKYHRDMTDPMAFRAHGPLHMQPGIEPPPPPPHMYSQHRGPSPVNYNSSNPSYPHGGRTPPSMLPANYDRRNHPGPHSHYRSPHMMSPYSSPTHEQYRSSYRSPPNRSPYPLSSPVANPHERPYIPSGSPHHEIYYPNESRSMASSRSAHSQHHTSSSSRSYGSSQQAPQPPPSHQLYGSHSSRRGPPSSSRHNDYPSDPPARFMSREFRRERFGSNNHPHEHDDTRPSRVLLVNNLDAAKTEKDLRETFEPFGIIEEMEIKAIAPDISSALIKFSSMDGAYKAKTANNGRHIGNLRCRIVYGKVNASKRLWIGGLSPSTTVSSMERECGRYGDVASMEYTSGRPYCYVEYETANQAQFAAHQLRTTLTPAPERKIRIEFVDPDRSEKLAPRLDSELGSKSRTVNEAAYESEASPRSAIGSGNRKRSVSPGNDMMVSKRLCQVSSDLPPMNASTFKQERLAVMAAKARTSSTTSSLGSHPISDKSDKIRHETNISSELNNNSDKKTIDNGDCSTPSRTPMDNDHSSQEAFSHDKLSSCSSIRELVLCCSVSWPGQMALRNFIFPAQIYMCSGHKQIIDRYLSKPKGSNGDSSNPILRITQRWRLHPQPKLEEVKRRMQSGNLGLLILTARQEISTPSRQSAINNVSQNSNLDKATQQQTNLPQQNGDTCGSSPSTAVKTDNSIEKNETSNNEAGPSNDSDAKSAANNEMSASERNDTINAQDTLQYQATATHQTGPATQTRPLRNLISYLEQKDAAGVVALHVVNPSDQGPSGAENSPKLLYAFPPGDFALNLLKRKAPNLLPESSREEYLLGVIVGGNVDCAKT